MGQQLSRASRVRTATLALAMTLAVPRKFSRLALFLAFLAHIWRLDLAPRDSGGNMTQNSRWWSTDWWTDRLATKIDAQIHRARFAHRAKRIVLVRHGQSMGNLNKHLYSVIPDNSMKLSPKGHLQADEAGKKLRQIVGSEESVKYYISPYERSKSTYQSIARWLPGVCIEEARLREQDFGNFQKPEEMKRSMRERVNFGRFYYRFNNGESGSDVYDRMASFCNTLFSDMDNHYERERKYDNIIVVTHGLTMRLFLMHYLRWTVDEFSLVYNPENCEIWVLELDDRSGTYTLKSELRIGGKSPRAVPAVMRSSLHRLHSIQLHTEDSERKSQPDVPAQLPEGATLEGHAKAPARDENRTRSKTSCEDSDGLMSSVASTDSSNGRECSAANEDSKDEETVNDVVDDAGAGEEGIPSEDLPLRLREAISSRRNFFESLS